MNRVRCGNNKNLFTRGRGGSSLSLLPLWWALACDAVITLVDITGPSGPLVWSASSVSSPFVDLACVFDCKTVQECSLSVIVVFY